MAAISSRSTRQSHSLDRPLRHDLFRRKSSLQTEDARCSLKPEDAERYYLYLPRNLSYCHVCADVLRQHVQRKVFLLNRKITEVFALPPKDFLSSLNKNYEREESDEDKENGIWLKTSQQEQEEPSKPKEILKKPASRRTISFPPPHHQGTKKVVRFADSLGLELETVRHVIRSELPPCIPSRAFHDIQRLQNEQEQLELVSDFPNPSSAPEFTEHLLEAKVCLHSVYAIETTIYGIVCVLNLTYHKTVKVRYTVNGWKSYHDIEATYVFPEDFSADDKDVDKFSFTIFIDRNDFATAYGVRNKVHFAVLYRTEDGKEYWDNNDQKNYTFSAHSVVVNGDRRNWVHFL